MNATSLPRFHIFGGALALVAAIALTGLLASSDTAHAQTFSPASSLGVADTTAGVNADITSVFGISAGDLQFGGTLNFTPPDWIIARDADIPDGALVAQLTAKATLGLIGGGCNNLLQVKFDMLDATTSQSNQVPFNDPEGELDPPDSSDKQGAEPDDIFDIGSDGLPQGATRYPDFLARIFKDPSGAAIVPISRMYGQTEVAGIEVSLNFVIFEPGTVFVTTAGETIPTDPRLGYPSATVLQSAGDPDTDADIETNNLVSDFCSPLTTDTTVFGETQDNPNTTVNEVGFPYRTNPGDGIHNFVTYAVSQRDADGDGIENGLDVCATIANSEWDPRETVNPGQTGDSDGDRLPNACDPDPSVAGPISGGLHDEDGDFYGNRGDNCPLVANSEGQLGGSGPGTTNQLDTDSDGIGDVCDDNPTTVDGKRFEICLVSPVTIGAGGTAPDPAPQNMLPCDPNAELPEKLAPGLTAVANATSAPPGSSVTLTTTLADDNGNPRVGENVTFKIESQPGSDADLVFAGIHRLSVSGSTTANLQGATEVTKVTDDSGKATAALDTGSTTGTITVSVTGGGDVKTLTIAVSAEASEPTTGTGTGVAGPDTGVGALAPAVASIPAWAAILSGLGGAGILGGLGALATRIFGIRLPGRRD